MSATLRTARNAALAVLAAAAFTIPAMSTASAKPFKRHSLAVATFTPLIAKRMKVQQRKIRRGRVSGRLTRFEARYLRSNLREVRFMKRLAARDGIVTKRERIRLHNMLDRNALRIRRLKNNRNRHFGRIGRVHFSLNR